MGQAAFVIGLLDGSRERDQVIAAAADHGIPSQATERVLALLAAGGALDDFPVSTLRELPPAVRAKLAPELATTSLAHRDGDGGARALARRRAAVIRIEGDRRIARSATRILSAAGVGEVHFTQPLNRLLSRPPAQPASHAPTPPPVARMARPPVSLRPDLVVLAGRQPVERLVQLAKGRIPHLAVMAGEAIGVVGPLVVPGRTACLLCLDYFRADSDPAWPLILAQLGQRSPEPPACDAVLAAAVAAQAAAQALIAIDKNPLASATANGTLELVLPDWRWRRRTWQPHPACPCSSHTSR
jgi:bacteriocin biosynthesis cyclodehydratase domain-containing protein